MFIMDTSIFVIGMNNFFRFGLILLIFIGLVVAYIRHKNFLFKCLIDKRILALLILGAFSTSLINIPVIISLDLMIAVNLGGVIIPLIISSYFIYKLRLNFIIYLLMIIIISTLTFYLSHLDRNIGIILDFPLYFIPIIFSVIFANIYYYDNPLYAGPLAYSISTLGVLFGADIIRLPELLQNNLRIGYIGGFGIFDLIYISGLYALVFSLLIGFQRVKYSQKIQIKEPRIKKLRLLNVEELKKNGINQHQCSPIIKRVNAFVIDCLIHGLIILIILFTLHAYLNIGFNELSTGIIGYTIFWWIVFSQILYFTFFEWQFGQTPGKRILNIQVITLAPGKESKKSLYSRHDFLSTFTRNILRIFDIIFFLLNILRLSKSNTRQRYGDHFAGTAVISI